jgi:diguanylate cyclase (GGDEF)-like protein
MRTVIVEDSAPAAAALREALAQLPSIEVIGSATTEDEAVQVVLSQLPDLVLLDLGLASGSGYGVLRRVRAAGNGARLVVVSNSASEAHRRACLAAGANDFFDNSRAPDALLRRIVGWLPPEPIDEIQRLKAVHAILMLGTAPEQAFDEVTALAAGLLGMPIALVSLVDERRQWFKSRFGLEVESTSRAVSFCGHAILGEDLMVVEDALADARFADNPLVRGEPRIRFYAGAPLALAGGEVVGTLCVIDRQPRTLDDLQRQTLRVLARLVVTEFELRRQRRDLLLESERRQQAEQHQMQLATRDPLTDLPNRAALQNRLRHGLQMAARDQCHLAFMFLDLDRFKYINDSLGHAQGDAVLQTVAKRLQGVVSEADTVARLGGDEFAILLHQPRDVGAVTAVADKLLEALAEPVYLGGQMLHLGASLGITLYPEHGDNAGLLMRRADLAMYEAKKDRTCRYRVFSADMEQAALQRLTLEQELRDALQSRQLCLHYQPQVSLARGGVTGVEALVRWQHPIKGLIAPMSFVPLAEETGLIEELGTWVLKEAVRQMAQWRRDGVAPAQVAVNVSPLQLRPGLPDLIEQVLRDNDLPPHMLEIEITETAIIADEPGAEEILSRLRALGVGVAIDDFGAGYSELVLARHLPITTLKVDCSFGEQGALDPHDATITQSVVSMGQSLAMRVVAEGVENPTQRVALQAMGCHDAQGYLFSRPMPADAWPAWQRSWQAAGPTGRVTGRSEGDIAPPP